MLYIRKNKKKIEAIDEDLKICSICFQTKAVISFKCNGYLKKPSARKNTILCFR